MVVRQKNFGRKELYETYVAQINWDWLFLKGQIIFGGIFVIGLIGFFFWFLQ